MADIYNHNQDQQVKKLKRVLEGWRMALLPLKSIFMWEQQWHPCAILALVSLFYLSIWLMDLNFLTAIAIIGLLVNLLDFTVPVGCNSICNPNSWTGQKEKVFEDICKALVGSYNKVWYHLYSFCSMRENSPFMYYVISISILCTTAFIGSTVNNTFLLYLLSSVVLLWPGLQKHGVFNFTLSMFTQSNKTLKSE